jgi:uncharacterized protein (TIGR03382 family)
VLCWEALLFTILAILGSAHAVCDQPFDHAVFIPPPGSTRVPQTAEVTVMVYGDFGIHFDLEVTADDVEVASPSPTATHFQDERPDPGGFIVFKPYANFDTQALHVMHLLLDDVEVDSSSFEVTTEAVRPLSTIPLVDVVDVSGEQDRNDTCGARTVRDVSLEIYPAESDPLEVSYLELHLIPPGNGANDETIYDVLPVPPDDTVIETTIEVPAEGAGDYCLTALQVNGAGERSGVATFVCLDGYLDAPDDKKCGCSHATPMGGVLSVLGLAFVAGRRRRPERA